MGEAYFPMFVDISEWKIVVAGGGSVAARRTETLLGFAGNITVIAPRMDSLLLEFEREGKITCLHRAYAAGDAAGADMVLAATDNKEVNAVIAQECRAAGQESGRHIMFNAADDRKLCDFYFPSVVQKDDITIGINSGGKHPGKVKSVRRKLQNEWDRPPFI